VGPNGSLNISEIGKILSHEGTKWYITAHFVIAILAGILCPIVSNFILQKPFLVMIIMHASNALSDDYLVIIDINFGTYFMHITN
jgi:hypothetical protein